MADTKFWVTDDGKRNPDDMAGLPHFFNDMVDYIAAMNQGKIAEFGTPHDLLKSGGIFSDLVDATGPESSKELRRRAAGRVSE